MCAVVLSVCMIVGLTDWLVTAGEPLRGRRDDNDATFEKRCVVWT